MSISPEDKTPQATPEFLSGGGEMGALMRAMDWAQTPLGPTSSWSPTLKMMTRFLLANRFPLLLWWGPQFCQLYNDAYRPILGTKHPMFLGGPVSECWSEIWHILRPLIETPFNGGPATWMEDIPLELNRYGFVEETHFTIAYSPVPDETVPSGIGGVLATVHEISEKVVGERRVGALRDLSTRAVEAKTAEEACAVAAKTLADHPKDIPFALLYLIDPDGQRARLAGAAGVIEGGPASLLAIEIGEQASGEQAWPLAEVVRSEAAQVVEGLAARFDGATPTGPWSDSPRQAVVTPIRSNIAHRLAGLFVAGVSPRLRLDDSYRSFIELAAGQIATAVANARAYEEERRRAEALAELDRAKTLFFSNVSHEFRTPLTLMLSPLEETLARSDGGLPPAERGQIELAHRNGLRLLKLVNTLLDFSRIEAGRTQAVYEPVDLAAYTAELSSVFRSAVEKAGLRLILNCPPLSEPVYVDREMWEKIVLNLLSNAFKFTLAGEIEVSLEETGGRVELRVRDTGTGIPADEISHVFERFHRVKGTQGRTHEGTGIGLALVQELIKLHGGTVTVNSALGRGTTFTVSLPKGKAHLPQERIEGARALASTSLGAMPYVEEALRWMPQDAAHTGASTNNFILDSHGTDGHSSKHATDGARVLLADDNADMRDYVRRLLEGRYEVEAVADGQAALDAARERVPDLVLTDVMMPRLDGFGLLKALRADERTQAVPVVMLSARAGEESKVEGLEAGADDYLVKPFSAKELLVRVEANLKMARIRREGVARLRESEERFAKAFNASPLVLTLTSLRTGKLLEVNDTFVRVTGYERADAVGRTTDELGLWDKRTRDDELATVRSDWQIRNAEYDFRMKDGTVIVGLLSAELLDIGGETCALTVIQDITSRKRAEEQLHEREAELKEAQRVGSIGSWRWDAETDVATGSDELLRIYGFDPASERLPNFAEQDGWLYPHESWARINAAVQQALETGVGYELDVAAFRGGAPIWITTRSEVVRDSEGKVVGLRGTVQDITARKQAEEALRDSTARFDIVRDSTQVGFWFCDLPFDNLIWDNRVKEHFWLPPDAEVTIETFYERLHADDRERTRRAIDESIANKTHYNIEYRTVAPDGREKWIRAIGRTFYDAQDHPIRFDGVTLDITEHKRAEEALRAAMGREQGLRVKAEEANRLKDEFLATVSHELRTPLTAILGWTHILRAGQLDGAGSTRALETVERNARSQQQLIEDLLDVSRVITGKLRLDIRPCDPAAVIEAAVESVRPAAEAKEVRLQKTLDTGVGAISGDSDRLQQVVWNLLSNAIKFTPKGGRVQVRLQRINSHVEIVVTDTGAGIPAEFLPHVFDRFRQADGSTTRAHGGLGLGLAIVRHLIEMHGGEVSADSHGAGQGATFTVKLPLIPVYSRETAEERVHPRAESTLSPVECPDRLDGLKVLVVDDEPDTCELLRILLTRCGAEVAAATSAEDALTQMGQSRFDLLVSDIGMPGADGYELIRRVRDLPAERGGQIPAIALTAYARAEDRLRALRVGYQMHVAKPVEPAEMIAVMASLAKRPQQG